jgi:hypothetical protein
LKLRLLCFVVILTEKKEGRGMICNARVGFYCSACGAEETIGWLYRHRAEVPNAAEVARKTLNLWYSEKWYGSEKRIPFVLAIVEELERLEKQKE